MFKFLNKKIPTPIAIIIIVLFALLVGVPVAYQYQLLFEEISTPPVIFSSPSEKYSECSGYYIVPCYDEDYSEAIKENIPCSNDNNCSLDNMKSYCSPGYPNILKCIGAKYYCGDDGFCKGCDCPI